MGVVNQNYFAGRCERCGLDKVYDSSSSLDAVWVVFGLFLA